MNRRRRQSAASAHERLQPWQLTAQVAAIVVAVGLVYLPAFRADFVWDEKLVLGGAPGYVASLVFFLLALLSNTQVVFLPVALLLCAWSRSGNATSASLRREVPRASQLFLLAAVLSLVTIWFQNRGIGE